MKYTIALYYGDQSGDGHGMYETDYFYSNYRTKDIAKAISAVEETYGLVVRNICSEYGQNYLTEEEYHIITNKMKLNLESYGEEDDGKFYVDDFPGLIIELAKHVLTDLEVEYMQITKDFYNIGGYGMFEN